MKKTALTLLCLIAFAPAAHADEQGRDAMMKSCMGGTTAQTDPERAEYCNCVQNSMSSWSEADFNEVAAQSAKAHSAAEEPAKLQDVAKACINKVLGAMPQ